MLVLIAALELVATCLYYLWEALHKTATGALRPNERLKFARVLGLLAKVQGEGARLGVTPDVISDTELQEQL
jgi:hypothetical protein